MCGIFGVLGVESISEIESFEKIANLAQRRGMDSSGLVICNSFYNYNGYRSDFSISKLLNKVDLKDSKLIIGHSRLITNGLKDNQPIEKNGIVVIHNGIIVNDADIWSNINSKRIQTIDTEIIAGITEHCLNLGENLNFIAQKIKEECKGTVSCVILIPRIGKVLLFSNNGSLYYGVKNNAIFFNSESYQLEQIGCKLIKNISNFVIFDIPKCEKNIPFVAFDSRNYNIIPSLGSKSVEEKSLQYFTHNLKRCSNCILPESMPFIKFNNFGICNYCTNYIAKEKNKSINDFFSIIENYRVKDIIPSLVPFSGGRDSSYALHLIVKEFGIKPITMTYDWGMVTDLARRNVSRMCSSLGVENIIIADNIEKKREYIALNLKAWLLKPHLGMLNILMAGDKHFFKFCEIIKKENNIKLNLWGMNHLETTHFKAGFLGFKPDFDHKQVFYTGAYNQFNYQFLRFKQFYNNPAYINRSLWDTLSGEYYRSIKKKNDFYNIFDYCEWDEEVVNQKLNDYDWERAPDSESTWRIGDGTAAFYNYVYYTVAGFSEFDTFRSNQIREGIITRDTALKLVNIENFPRYPNIKWYLDALKMDFKEVISVINNIPKMYEV